MLVSTDRRWPLLTTITLTATLLGTCTRLFGNGVFDALRRDPNGLAHGQLWRLVTPVLVQGDHSALTIAAVFALCAVIGAVGERLLSRWEWLALYGLGVLVGHGIGEVFQPHQSGTSVAFAAILGGIVAHVLCGGGPRNGFWRWRLAALIPLAILGTILRDIHGLPFLGGLTAGLLLARQGRGRPTSLSAARP
jgi:rhomboid protease GluP